MSEPVIITSNLTRRFGETLAVDHLNFEVQAGEVFAFLGHNGAGKTTTVRLLNGVLATSEGSARVLGLDPATDGPALRRRTGVLTETPSLDERLTARTLLSIYADLFDVPKAEVIGRVDDLLSLFGLSDRADEKVGGYSRGMKQRLALARAFLHKPDILFLDEPTSGLDPVAARRVHEMILHLSADQGRTVFLCTHNLVEAQKLCHRVAVMEHGQLVAMGTPADLARRTVRTHSVVVEVAHGDAQLAVETLRGVSAMAVDGLSEDRGVITITGLGREGIPQVLFALAAAGVRIYRVAEMEPSLEDVYFALHDGWGEVAP